MTKEKVIEAARGWVAAAALYECWGIDAEAAAETEFITALEELEAKWTDDLMRANDYVIQARTAYYELAKKKEGGV